MKTVYRSVHWFVIGMGHVLGISPLVTPLTEGTEMEAIGRDFRAVGSDLSQVMRRVPPTPQGAIALGESAQLELSGIR
jgi:hypothetical protein